MGYFACESENVPSLSSSNAVHSEIFIWLVLKKRQGRIQGRILKQAMWRLILEQDAMLHTHNINYICDGSVNENHTHAILAQQYRLAAKQTLLAPAELKNIDSLAMTSSWTLTLNNDMSTWSMILRYSLTKRNRTNNLLFFDLSKKTKIYRGFYKTKIENEKR